MSKRNKCFLVFSFLMILQSFAFYKVKVETWEIDNWLFLTILWLNAILTAIAYILSEKSILFKDENQL